MAAVTQALEIAAVAERCTVALVVDDVVDVSSTDAPTGFGALAAEWLAHQLCRAQVPAPLISEVHPAPGLGLSAALS